VDNPAYGLLLRAFGRLPRGVRRALIHWGAPSYSVGAMCVVEHEGRVLLVRQSYRDGWAAPGGLLQRGEEPDAAARREAKEEVDIDVEILGEPLVVIDVKARRIDVVFRCRVEPPVPEAFAPDSVEILDAQWFPRDALPAMQKETAEAFRRVYAA